MGYELGAYIADVLFFRTLRRFLKQLVLFLGHAGVFRGYQYALGTFIPQPIILCETNLFSRSFFTESPEGHESYFIGSRWSYVMPAGRLVIPASR